eukprot:TRINITY_DN7214_c0_g2_i1.p1 TRINITY_DN7214_c0_g2~~TRINITY_DN7214_c0_g2_i1.p1  ORF type:complete len:475 (+),score=134.53 TRINITY_DN7214_c0_g2_i1:71-1495(+)
MGITTFYEEMEGDVSEVFQYLSDNQINSILWKLMDQPRVSSEMSVANIYPEHEEKEEEEEKDPETTISIIEKVLGEDHGGEADLVGKGGKMWKIKCNYNITVVTFGGKNGPFDTHSASHASPDDAKKFAVKAIAEKRKEGYRTSAARSKLLIKIKESRESAEVLTQTEIGKLKRDQVVAKLEELKIEFDAKATVAKLKDLLNGYYSELSSKKEEKEEAPLKRKLEKNEEDDEPSSKKQDAKDDQQSNKEEEKVENNNNAETPNDQSRDTLKNLDGPELADVSLTRGQCKDIAADDNIWRDNYLKKWGDQLNPSRLETMKKNVESKATTWKQLYTQQDKWDNKLEEARVTGLDKAGAAVEYVVALACGIAPSGSDAPLDKFLGVKTAGEDVCYGPIYICSPDAVAKLNDKLKDINPDQAMEDFFNLKTLPKLMGSLCVNDSSLKDDTKYVLHHLRNYQIFIRGCAARKNGFLRHY